MNLKEIIEAWNQSDIHEKRSVGNDYAEIVIYSKEKDGWNKIFADILGPAIKPPGVEPTEDDRRLTEDYGGISKNQTLFKKNFEGDTVLAMFWPWQDDEHITLKMFIMKK